MQQRHPQVGKTAEAMKNMHEAPLLAAATAPAASAHPATSACTPSACPSRPHTANCDHISAPT
eukprot:6172880-Pleurochrysis_carterae.AAC.2